MKFQKKKPKTMDALPDKILKNILISASQRVDLQILALTCKRWYKLLKIHIKKRIYEKRTEYLIYTFGPSNTVQYVPERTIVSGYIEFIQEELENLKFQNKILSSTSAKRDGPLPFTMEEFIELQKKCEEAVLKLKPKRRRNKKTCLLM